jgi:hypothetical protein
MDKVKLQGRSVYVVVLAVQVRLQHDVSSSAMDIALASLGQRTML